MNDSSYTVLNYFQRDILAIPLSQRRLSQAVNTILWKERKKSDIDIEHTVHIFPHKDFVDVLPNVVLEIRVEFEEGEPITKTTSPTWKDYIEVKFETPDLGEPDRIIMTQIEPELKRDKHGRLKWLLDCVTGTCFNNKTDFHQFYQ